MMDLDAHNFTEFINRKFAVVEFYTTYCPHCRIVGNMLESLCHEMDIDGAKINVDRYDHIGNKFEIEMAPTVIAFSNGEPIGGFIGAVTRMSARAELERLANHYNGSGSV